MKSVRLLLAFVVLASVTVSHATNSLLVSGRAGLDDFVLGSEGITAPFVVEASIPRPVARAADDLRADIERVSSGRPSLLQELPESCPRALVVIGVVGQSPLLDRLVADKKLDVSGLTGAWESFAISVVRNPLPEVEQALVIVGSDTRGAIGADRR